MAEELQGLLNRIQADGLNKAEDERNRIVSEAKRQADQIISAAKEQADRIVREAKAEAETAEMKSQAAIRQAARDIMIALRSDLSEKLRIIAKSCAGEAMTPDFMTKIIGEMVTAFAKDHNCEKLDLILSVQEGEDFKNRLNACLFNSLKANPQITLSSDFSAGLKIGFNGDDVYLDFSDEELANVICDFVGPKLASIIKG